MTKEAKIGMLTGLGVIVLIGVLLSEYLGDKNSTMAAGPTGRMAPLQVGATYRDQLTSPIGVPAMAPVGSVAANNYGPEVAISTGHDSAPGAVPMVLAADGAVLPSGPVAARPVTPIEGGPVLADARIDAPPMISIKDTGTMQVKLQDTPKAKDAPKPAVVTHTVVAGDTLAKIAKQYYGSAKNSDVQKIVAANTAVLKDATTMLVVSKKLVIPGIAPVAPAAVAPIVTGPMPAPAKGGAAEGVIVYPPSASMTEAIPPTMGPVPAPKTDLAKTGDPKAGLAKADNKDTKKTYVVQSGDTLEKIAKRLAPSKTTDMVQKLMSLNGIKDPTRLQAGSPLKMPA